jgi:lactate dehydrogenase-like 2-hydroxyacid dehydrogenase
MSHEEIAGLMEHRCSGRRRQRVSEDDIERWVADEAWAERHQVEMMNAEIEWNRETSSDELRDESVVLGSLSTHRPDGVIRAMMTQLNNISTARVRNRKAAQLQRLVQHYEIQVIGMGEIGINMSLERHGKRLTTLLPDLGMQVRCTSAHNRLERISLHQPGGVGILLVGDI